MNKHGIYDTHCTDNLRKAIKSDRIDYHAHNLYYNLTITNYLVHSCILTLLIY